MSFLDTAAGVALTVSIASGLGAAFAFMFQRATRLDAGFFDAQFAEAELSVRTAIDEREKDVADGMPGITWGDLKHGNIRDDELRERFDQLLSRLSRLEAASESLGVRRQALLETYHRQGLLQSRVSFVFSLVLGSLGFGVIVFAVVSRSEQVGTYISGVITEAVAALFFTQSNAARALMAEFFDRLRADRRLEEALRLADGIDDPRLKGSLQALLAMQFVESSHSPSVLPGFGADPGDISA